MYTKVKMLSTTSFGKSVRYEVLLLACYTVKKQVGYRAGSYAVVLKCLAIGITLIPLPNLSVCVSVPVLVTGVCW